MPLEAVMIAVDNSEWMRNGDYPPTRMDAQQETVNYIANAKINDNPESEVGVMSIGGDRVQVHTSMCRSMGTIMSVMQKDIRTGNHVRLIHGLKVAQLALKNRQNRSQKQRVILFVGSPITEDQAKLVKLGQNFKKNKIAVDVISFGSENFQNENTEKLEAFVAAVNSKDNSHLVTVPPGPHVLSDLVLSSSIMVENGGVPAAAGGGGGAVPMDQGGDMDEDLAMAIRMSMEDERQRQERASAPATPATTTTAGADAPAAPAKPAAAAEEEEEEDEDDDEAAMLAAAIAMSMQENLPAETPTPTPAPAAATPTATTSTTTTTPAAATTTAPTAAPAADEEDIAAALQDKDFLADLLSSVPGVEQGDMAIDDILMNLGGDDEEEADKDKDKDKK